jgi:hypothetical protein
MSGGVPPLPATVLSFADVALTVCSFSWHLATSFATQTHTTSCLIKLVLQRKFYQMNKGFFFVYCGAIFKATFEISSHPCLSIMSFLLSSPLKYP